MKSTFFLLAFVAIVFSSCAPENRVYEKHQSLSPDVEWLKTDKKTFGVEINDPASTYQFNLAFRYATGYMWNEAKIIVEETSPSGMKKITPYTLKIREENGDYIGEAGYDIWDSTHLVESDYRFKEDGTYTYILSHDMPRDEFPFAMEVGLIIDKNI